jgi:NAD(P)-dependent dehydrogenase (short-subunit alcohol dehydrogenase family)
MRRVLITGGTGNIGAKLVQYMLNDGHFVYFSTRTAASGQDLIKSKGLDTTMCKPVILDFSQEKAVDTTISQIDEFPDCIIHNARSLETLNVEQNGMTNAKSFQQEFFNGVTFPYLLTMTLINHTKELRDVLFISSMYGNVAPSPSLYENFEMQSPINYGVVKAAQIHLVKELAVRLAHQSIRVNAISYGGVEGRVDEAFKRRYAKLTPSGRMLTYADLYPPIKYFIDNEELNVTGENLKVDGGWTIW